jgi:hypothetical protein
MQRLILFCIVSLLAVLACKEPAAKATAPATAQATPSNQKEDTCPEYFYYYQQEKVSLKLKPYFLLVGFQKELTLEQRAQILQTFAEYENITANQTSDATPFNVIKLKATTSCKRTLEIIKQLQTKNEITFANPVFNPTRQMGEDLAWVGLTPSVLVTIKNADQLPELKAKVAETKTEITDTLGETTFLIQVTKQATSNALEIANYFHSLPFVTNSEPDFYMATKEQPVTK